MWWPTWSGPGWWSTPRRCGDRTRRTSTRAGAVTCSPSARRRRSASDLAGLDAGGADVQTLVVTGDRSVDPLDVGIPAAAGLFLRPRDHLAGLPAPAPHPPDRTPP